MNGNEIAAQTVTVSVENKDSMYRFRVRHFDGTTWSAPSERKSISISKRQKPPESLRKYLKMLQVKVPLQAVKNKMKRDGRNAQELDLWLNGGDAPKQQKEPPERLRKYLKMIRMKIPLRVIESRMKQQGLDPQELENWMNAQKPQQKPPKELEKYLKMIRMKIPVWVVKNKMKEVGLGHLIPMLEQWL